MQDLELIKQRLRDYSREEVGFYEPHFTINLNLREGNKEEVIHNLLHPEKLVFCSESAGKYGDAIYSLHFQISNTKTLILPVIFNRNNKKSLYVITYIMRHRKWKRTI